MQSKLYSYVAPRVLQLQLHSAVHCATRGFPLLCSPMQIWSFLSLHHFPLVRTIPPVGLNNALFSTTYYVYVRNVESIVSKNLYCNKWGRKMKSLPVEYNVWESNNKKNKMNETYISQHPFLLFKRNRLIFPVLNNFLLPFRFSFSILLVYLLDLY